MEISVCFYYTWRYAVETDAAFHERIRCRRVCLRQTILNISKPVVILVLIVTGTVRARVLYVDREARGGNDGSTWYHAYNALQDGLAAARAGDEIRVARGIYHPDRGRNVFVGDRNASFYLPHYVSLYGGFPSGGGTWDQRDPDRHLTVLSGDLAENDKAEEDPAGLGSAPERSDNSYHVLTVCQTVGAFLDGFTITAGHAWGDLAQNDPRLDGGGLYMDGGRLKVHHCRFVANAARDKGGALCARDGTLLWQYNVIQQNTAAEGGGLWCKETGGLLRENLFLNNVALSDGGGLHCFKTEGLLITDNVLQKNRAEDGGAVYMEEVVLTDLTYNTIVANQADENGGGLYCRDSDPVIASNVLQENRAEDGAGFWIKKSAPRIAHNMIVGNEARDDGGAGCCRSGNPELTNNTVVGNRATTGSAFWAEEDSRQVVSNCLFWENGAEFLYGCRPRYCFLDVLQPGEGNITGTPYFMDPLNGNYHLRSFSPCIDQGDNSVLLPDARDFDGDMRLEMGQVDIGADEVEEPFRDGDGDGLPDRWEEIYFRDLSATPEGDPDGDGISTLEEYRAGTYPALGRETVYVSNAGTADDQADGSIAFPFRSIQEGINASRASVYVAEGTYRQSLVIDSKTLAIEGGYAPDFSRRDPALYPTTVVADRGSCILYHAVAGGSLSGFTIRGGKANTGGGICCRSASPRISRCIIKENHAFDGAGIFCTGRTAPTVQNCLLFHNEAEDDGGAFFCDNDCSPVIVNNTVVSNRAHPSGGGIYCKNGSRPVVANCIFWDNGDELYGCAATHSCVQDLETLDQGNLNRYPHFVDSTGGDYHLLGISPCIDAGDTAKAGDIAHDFDGEQRIQLQHVDIGADEALTRSTDSDGDRLPDDWERMYFNHLQASAHDDSDGDEISNLEEYYQGSDPLDPSTDRAIVYVDVHNQGDPLADGTRDHPWHSIQRAVDQATQEIRVAAGRYQENVVVDRKTVHISGGYAPDFSQRAPTPFQTILDAGHTGRGLTYINVEGGSLSGFTITNGLARDGAGIYCIGSSPTITNNIITRNMATDDGGGIFCKARPCPSIIGNRITSNRATNNGGGIYVRDAALTIANNLVSNNRADTGAGVRSRDSFVQLIHNTIIGNIADDEGGGFYCRGNLAEKQTVIAHCILWGNTARDGGAQIALGTYQDPSAPSVLYCCLQPGQSAFKAETECQLVWEEGNIRMNPSLSGDGHLRADSLCINRGRSDYSLDTDLDGEVFASDQRNDIGADEFQDDDLDGLADGWERRHFGSLDRCNPHVDSDGDSLSNLQEYHYGSQSPNRTPLTVSSAEKSIEAIQATLDAARDGDTVVVPAGRYTDINGQYLDFAGKAVILVAPSGPSATVLDWDGNKEGVLFGSGETATSVIMGFGITHSNRNGITCNFSAPQIVNCILEENKFNLDSGNALPVLANCVLDGQGVVEGSASIAETVTMPSGTWRGNNLRLLGEGRLNLGSDARLECRDAIMHCRISGPGTLHIGYRDRLVLEGDSVIDLTNEGRDQMGMIQCEGKIFVRDRAQIRHSVITIERNRDHEESEAFLRANVTHSWGTASSLIAEDAVQILDNDIYALGDRYLTVDPASFDGHIADNRITVRIMAGAGGRSGDLLECRGQAGLMDWDGSDPFLLEVAPDSLPDSDLFSWTLEELVLEDHAKVNLTNRFDYQAPWDEGGQDEVLYVRHLVLGEHAILNGSFQRLVYETLALAPSAQIKQIPLLGFSLINIAFDEIVDYEVRVQHNNRIYKEPDMQVYNREGIQRIAVDLDPNGVMVMENLQNLDPNALTYLETIHARAQGSFGSSSEEEIYISFAYLFEVTEPNTAITIYLTDSPDMLDPNDPGRAIHYVEVGRVPAPPAGRPGSVGSGRWGYFQRNVPKGDLNFIRGTRMELELIGAAGSRVLINDWDPQVLCGGLYCGDVTGDNGVTVLDLDTVIAHSGAVIDPSPAGGSGLSCLEFAFSSDGRIDSLDTEAWCLRLSDDAPLNLCHIPLLSPEPPITSAGIRPAFLAHGKRNSNRGLKSLLSNDALLVSGLTRTESEFTGQEKAVDTYWVLDTDSMQGYGMDPAFPQANGKFLRGPAGRCYQWNHRAGLIDIEAGRAVVKPSRVSLPSEPRYHQAATVTLGMRSLDQAWSGRPLLDGAFDGDGFLYAGPVIVEPMDEEPYLAVAKLRLYSGTASYDLMQLYAAPALPHDNQEHHHIREVELDSSGRLYVLNAHSLNESDILWIFDTASGRLIERLELASPDSAVHIPAPHNLIASQKSDWLYLASSLNPPDANSVKLYVFTPDADRAETIEVKGMGHITGMTEDPATGDLWICGFVMLDIPEYLTPGAPPFYKPCVAYLPSSQETQDLIYAQYLKSGNELGLPLSILWIGGHSTATMIE